MGAEWHSALRLAKLLHFAEIKPNFVHCAKDIIQYVGRLPMYCTVVPLATEQNARPITLTLADSLWCITSILLAAEYAMPARIWN